MIDEKIREILENISKTALGCGRDPQEIRLVAVSKRFPAEAMLSACAAGQFLFGENYIQEVKEKASALPPEANIHFIGHLQSNKAKTAAMLCSMVETVDRLSLARELDKHCATLNKTLNILVQVNIGLDEKKSGTTAEECEQLLRDIGELPRLRTRGLMTIPPFTDEAEDARPYFQKLRELSEILKAKELFADNTAVELSMGMSADYPVAIEEGATLVRIGTAIFGQRHS